MSPMVRQHITGIRIIGLYNGNYFGRLVSIGPCILLGRGR